MVIHWLHIITVAHSLWLIWLSIDYISLWVHLVYDYYGYPLITPYYSNINCIFTMINHWLHITTVAHSWWFIWLAIDYIALWVHLVYDYYGYPLITPYYSNIKCIFTMIIHLLHIITVVPIVWLLWPSIVYIVLLLCLLHDYYGYPLFT